jgi:hypothetical protein
MPRKLALWFVLLIVGFLTGFILQYCQTAAGTAGTVCLDKTIGLLSGQRRIVAASRHSDRDVSGGCAKNYGKAGAYSKEFFDQAQRIQSSTEDPALRNLLRDTLATRDQITADLAKGDAAALSEIQPLLSKIEQTAKH